MRLFYFASITLLWIGTSGVLYERTSFFSVFIRFTNKSVIGFKISNHFWAFSKSPPFAPFTQIWAKNLLLFVRREAAYLGFMSNAIDKESRINWKDVLHASSEFGITSSSSGPISIVSKDSLPKIRFGDFPLGLSKVLIDGVLRNVFNYSGLSGLRDCLYLGDSRSSMGNSFLFLLVIIEPLLSLTLISYCCSEF